MTLNAANQTCPVGEVEDLCVQLAGARRITVLTGAGVSTDSGIPDYRDDAGQWKHQQPMKFQQFSRSHAARQRYWARSLVGSERIRAAQPNGAHRALAELEVLGKVELLVTQNVDRLHQKAGSQKVLDLHGRLDVVECLGCRAETARSDYQRLLAERNQSFTSAVGRPAPDGDAELEEVDYSKFRVPPCTLCGGVQKPGVVFFGESVPSERVRAVMTALERSDALLVVGSSLMIMSGYRFALAAERQGLPVLIVNRGKTRADQIASLKVVAPVSEALPAVMERLLRRG